MIKPTPYIQITAPGSRFVSLQNRQGKVWLIPVQNAKTALEVYQPSSVKGKTAKALLGWDALDRLGAKAGLLSAWDVRLAGRLKELLDDLYQGYQVSMFGGTPSPDQKITLQVFRGKEILGYCKLGDTDRARALFRHEKEILDTLEACGVDHVPRCLGVFDLDPGTSVLIQTTEKKTGAKTGHSLGPRHKAFLRALFEKTKREVAFEDTDYGRSLLDLQGNIPALDPEYRGAVTRALEGALQRYRGKRVRWGVCHRDFTPWNTCVTGDGLFAFDFEYALRYGPPGLDRWHFLVQTLRYEKGRSPDQMADALCRNFPGSRDSLELYLLDNLSLYLSRKSPADREMAHQQAHLLKRIDTI